jgi:hypothetical protein
MHNRMFQQLAELCTATAHCGSQKEIDKGACQRELASNIETYVIRRTLNQS